MDDFERRYLALPDSSDDEEKTLRFAPTMSTSTMKNLGSGVVEPVINAVDNTLNMLHVPSRYRIPHIRGKGLLGFMGNAATDAALMGLLSMALPELPAALGATKAARFLKAPIMAATDAYMTTEGDQKKRIDAALTAAVSTKALQGLGGLARKGYQKGLVAGQRFIQPLLKDFGATSPKKAALKRFVEILNGAHDTVKQRGSEMYENIHNLADQMNIKFPISDSKIPAKYKEVFKKNKLKDAENIILLSTNILDALKKVTPKKTLKRNIYNLSTRDVDTLFQNLSKRAATAFRKGEVQYAESLWDKADTLRHLMDDTLIKAGIPNISSTRRDWWDMMKHFRKNTRLGPEYVGKDTSGEIFSRARPHLAANDPEKIALDRISELYFGSPKETSLHGMRAAEDSLNAAYPTGEKMINAIPESGGDAREALRKINAAIYYGNAFDNDPVTGTIKIDPEKFLKAYENLSVAKRNYLHSHHQQKLIYRLKNLHNKTKKSQFTLQDLIKRPQQLPKKLFSATGVPALLRGVPKTAVKVTPTDLGSSILYNYLNNPENYGIFSKIVSGLGGGVGAATGTVGGDVLRSFQN